MGIAREGRARAYGDYGRLARLRSPVGYWNALALVVVFGLPTALWAATRARHSRVVKAGAVVVLYALLVALVLTYSRGGILAALVVLGLWFWLTRERFDSMAAFVTAAVPAAPVVAVALALPGIAQDGQPRSVRAAGRRRVRSRVRARRRVRLRRMRSSRASVRARSASACCFGSPRA